MVEATYTYYSTASPNMEIFDVTTAPTDGLTLTSRKFSNPLVCGFASTSSTANSNDVQYYTTSGGTITIKVAAGTGIRGRVTVVNGNI